MIKKYLLPILAFIGFGLGVVAAVRSAQSLVPTPMVSNAPSPPFQMFVAGAGLVEANTENIAIGTHIAGIVAQIYVEIGSHVKRGAPLFSIDDRAIQATLASLQAAVKVADSQLAQAQYESRIGETLAQKNVISSEDASLRKYVADTAAAQREFAQAQASATAIDAERFIVRAPVDGEILQLKIHPGEFAQTGVVSTPLLLMGNLDPLHIRVDVDENEAWRVFTGASAVGYLRGNADISMPLNFVRFEPYVIPKVSLTGASKERVDTRVMQIIYSFSRGSFSVKPGQQMDVYIDAPPQTPTPKISLPSAS